VPKTAAAEPTPAPTTSAVAQAANEPPAASAPEPEAAPRQSHPAAAESAKVERSKVKGPEGASERPWGTTKSAPPRSQPLVAEPAAKAPVEPGEKNGIGDPEAARANGQGGNGKEKGNGRADE
jgi:hypothetical protein